MFKAFYAALVLVILMSGASAQTMKWGDQHNGTYANPILPGDFADPDAIRVGAEYFCITSTRQSSPGILVMSSKDMVNWKIAGHVVNDISQINPGYNFNKMQLAINGITAGTIRFHDNKYTVCFADATQGVFLATAEKANTPWKPAAQLLKGAGWDSPCVLWDDNGQGYLSAVNTTEGKVHLFKLNTDGDGLVPGADNVINQLKGIENVKLYKIKTITTSCIMRLRPR